MVRYERQKIKKLMSSVLCRRRHEWRTLWSSYLLCAVPVTGTALCGPVKKTDGIYLFGPSGRLAAFRVPGIREVAGKGAEHIKIQRLTRPLRPTYYNSVL